MVKKLLFTVLVLVALTAAPRTAVAGCTTTLADCFTAAAKIDSFWYRWAAGIDCELDYVECARQKLIGA
jgi:hypothetical protein